VSEASSIEIDQFNVLQATMLAMKRAIIKLKTKPKIVLIDGNKSPKIKNYFIKTVIKGDQKIPEISAASIIAKVSRDKLITDISKKFKSYKWHLNAGYGTKEHLRAIKKFGITKFHRKTFKPIHNILSLNKSK
jgi:ribonuclease HII